MCSWIFCMIGGFQLHFFQRFIAGFRMTMIRHVSSSNAQRKKRSSNKSPACCRKNWIFSPNLYHIKSRSLRFSTASSVRIKSKFIWSLSSTALSSPAHEDSFGTYSSSGYANSVQPNPVAIKIASHLDPRKGKREKMGSNFI